MLWAILLMLVTLWLIGLIAEVGGGLIHLLLLAAGVILLINLIRGRAPA